MQGTPFGVSNRALRRAACQWSVHTFMARTHVDIREECVWFNFPKPLSPHDDRYLETAFVKEKLSADGGTD